MAEKVMILIQALDTKSQVFCNGLEIASNINASEICRRGIDCLGIEDIVQTLIIMLQLEKVMTCLLRDLSLDFCAVGWANTLDVHAGVEVKVMVYSSL